MRNRDYFLPSISTLILFGMVWFLSCAHQNRFKEEDEAAFEPGVEQPFVKDKDTLEQATEQVANQAPQTDSNADADFAVNSEEPRKPEISQSSEQRVEPQEQVAQEEAQKSPEAAEPSTEAPVIHAEAETTSPEAQAEEVSRPAVNKSYTARAPKIPRKAFVRRGSKVNRFYFARKGDSPKKVSALIYSNNKFAKKLAHWNGKVWTPGQVIFYVSPTDPKDKKMTSFYQERDIQPEEYQVQAGDWLTRIAHKKLGSARSWKELAVLNGLKSPNALEAGQTLAVYPKNLFKALQAPAEKKYAKMEEAPVARPSRPEPMLAKPADPPPVFENKIPEPAPAIAPAPVAPPPAAVVPSPEPEAEAPAEQAGNLTEQPAAAMNWNQLVEQNSIAILIGAALIILLLALAARKKRVKARASSSSNSDSGEITEDTPSKFRRR